ncbi:hypothetical protein A9Q97_01885 [Rhodospirillales bacterium 47_12_T64]|nr:hypothetical protein A9Q97_01885 [Rhodospirillales bacterium 47_12_T64]
MTSFTELEKSLQTLSIQIANASSVAKTGEVSDVSDLPRVTDFLCQEINKLPPSERSKLGPHLIGLIEELDNLTITIGSSLDKVRVEIKETTSHNRAAKAYTSANTPGKR